MLVDVSVEEARKLKKIQGDVNFKYLGRHMDKLLWAVMKDELTTRSAEVGFVVKAQLMRTPQGNFLPVVEVVGRTDKNLESALQREGVDVEHKHYDATHIDSDGLKEEGIDPDLLIG